MKNNEQIFDLSSYRTLLRYLLASKLDIKNFNDDLSKGRNLIMRHDIDFCPARALELAELERRNNIKSTFFFLVNTDFYNLNTNENINIVKKILSLGHKIGLHFDADIYTDYVSMNKACKNELNILENIISRDIDIISFHRPSKSILTLNRKLAGKDHTYMKKFTKSINYCSDSQGRWLYENPKDIISKNIHNNSFTLHLLIHPIWWTTPKDLAPGEKIDYHLKRMFKNINIQAAKNCKPFSNYLRKI